MTKDEILELAKRAGFDIDSTLPNAWFASMERFANLIESAVIKRLSAGAGAPIGKAHLCDSCDTPFDGAFYCPDRTCGHNTATQKPVYSQDQVAAAVAAERGRICTNDEWLANATQGARDFAAKVKKEML